MILVRRSFAATIVVLLLACGGVHTPPHTIEPSINPGRNDAVLPESPSKRKYVIAVLSEGFIAGTDPNVFGNQRSFERFANALEQHVKAFPPFDDASRFVFRPIFVHSAEAGISTPQQTRNTAFGILFHGIQSDCYFTVSDDAVKKISKEARREGNVDYTVVLINSSNPRGCAIQEKIALVPRTASGGAAIHELGHTIGALYDEYHSAATSNEPITSGNCSTGPAATDASWRDLFNGDVPVPTEFNSPLQIGMFKGCARRTDAFRPTRSCAMFDGNDFYCRVCDDLMKKALDAAPPLSPPLTELYTYYRFIVRGSGSDANPTIADQWGSFEPPRGGVQPLHGIWTLTVGERTVLGASAVTADPLHWRAYPGTDKDGPPDHHVPAPYSVVEIAVPLSRLFVIPPGFILDPRLELYRFEQRTENAPAAMGTIPTTFTGPAVEARSPQLTNAVLSLFQ